MLNLFFFNRFFSCFSYSILLLITFTSLHFSTFLHSIEHKWMPETIKNHGEEKWIGKYFDTIDENTTIEEVISFLVSFKHYLQLKGYECPSLQDLFFYFQENLIDREIDLDEHILNEIYEEIVAQESETDGMILSSSISNNFKSRILQAKRKHKIRIDIPPKMTVGFLKCLAGGLLCVIPVSGTRVVGTGLIVNGINDCVHSARESSDKNKKKREVEELPEPPPHFPSDYFEPNHREIP